MSDRCYCSKSLIDHEWRSAWGENEEQHYKKQKCASCGRINWKEAGYQGSGHDVKDNSLESVVRKVRDK